MSGVNLALLITTEIVFACALALFVCLAMSRLKLKRQDGQMTELEVRNKQLADELGMLKLKRKFAAAEPAVSPVDSEQVDILQKRIANLEKFRELYFTLEARLNDFLEGDPEDCLQLDLDGELDVQAHQQHQHLIDEMQSRLHDVCDQYQLESSMRTSLEQTVALLQNSIANLKDQVRQSACARLEANRLKETLENARARVSILEENEKRLLRQARELKEKSLAVKNHDHPPQNFGGVKVAEIERMSHLLAKKNREFRQLQHEYSEVTRKYKQLVVKNLKLAKARTSNNQDQNKKIEALRKQFKDSSSALAKKVDECRELESHVTGGSGTPTQGQMSAMQKALGERRQLENNMRDLAEQSGQLTGDDSSSKELLALRQGLEEKERILNESRANLMQLQSEMEKVRSEDESLKGELEAVRNENERLTADLAALKGPTAEQLNAVRQLSELQAKYAELEDKYLKMAAKRLAS